MALQKIFKKFWLEIKSPVLLSFKKGFLTEEFSTSQKQAAIKLLVKKIEIKKVNLKLEANIFSQY